jgi:NADH-quinone oxidoreductase subunit L
MQFLLLLFIIIPVSGFILSLLFKNYQEKIIANIAISFIGASLILSIIYFGIWLYNGCTPLQYDVLSIYDSGEFDFGIDLFYDKLSAVYAIVASILLFIVAIFSKTYMHRESGFKRFYNHFLLFYIGINILIFSGNFETLFLGWEIVGVTSFLLISFYRDRYLPVRNAMKVLSFYRLGDVALIGAVWFCHHLFEQNIPFVQLGITPFVNHDVMQLIIVSILFIIASAVKSAQFPFSSWLPRAMEGPTVSSAIFYGSLSVHIGVFLLIRTYPIWSHIAIAKIVIICVGGLSAIIASFIASVQPTAKTQISYSSISQIGFIFIEIAMGWHVLALIHFSANAFLRTYQMLVSPSIMSYLVHEQFFKYDATKKSMFHFLPKKLFNTLYILSVKEFNMDTFWMRFVWMPFKKIGKSFHFLRNRFAEIVFLVLIILGLLFYILFPLKELEHFKFVYLLYAVIALVLILIAWTERLSAVRAWIYVALSQVFFMLAIAEQHTFGLEQVAIYLSGTIGAFVVGMWCLHKVKSIENNISLNEFHGHIYEHPKFALLFLLCALTMIGFPISPTFIGLDILFSDIEINHGVLLLLSGFTFIILELAVLRIYARIFMGQHAKTYHEVAYRSS